MMYAQLRDNNQGVIKITSGGMNRSPTAGAVSFDKETRWSAVLNGNGQAGMLVLSQAMRMAIDKAKVHGFGIVGTNHTSTSTGALGYYAEQVGGLPGGICSRTVEQLPAVL
jgi:LDH2 family malate/lactate/ureidoglycolate dehydrogenase